MSTETHSTRCKRSSNIFEALDTCEGCFKQIIKDNPQSIHYSKGFLWEATVFFDEKGEEMKGYDDSDKEYQKKYVLDIAFETKKLKAVYLLIKKGATRNERSLSFENLINLLYAFEYNHPTIIEKELTLCMKIVLAALEKGWYSPRFEENISQSILSRRPRIYSGRVMAVLRTRDYFRDDSKCMELYRNIICKLIHSGEIVNEIQKKCFFKDLKNRGYFSNDAGRAVEELFQIINEQASFHIKEPSSC